MGLLHAEVRLSPGGCTMPRAVTAGMELRSFCSLLSFHLVIIERDVLVPRRGCRPVLALSALRERDASAAREQPRLRQSQGAGAVKNGRMWALKGKNSRNKPDCRVQIVSIYRRSLCALEDTKHQVSKSAEAAEGHEARAECPRKIFTGTCLGLILVPPAAPVSLV